MTIIRLVTWNVASARLPEPDLDAVANVLKDLDPDVVALQELDRVRERSGGADQAAALAEALGMSSWYAPTMLYDDPVGPSWRPLPEGAQDPGGPAYGIGLLSRLPMEDVERIVLPAPGWPWSAKRRTREPRVALAGELVLDGRRVTVAAAHLTNIPGWRAWQLLTLQFRLAARPAPRVLVGDLNLRPISVRVLSLRPLPVRVWRPVVRGRTFPRGAPGRQLDHVLVAGRGLAARSGRVAEARVSDHLPVVVELEPR
jgi:endonuclease/exonuclease/phosphatase family metal-dependent hydrolase